MDTARAATHSRPYHKTQDPGQWSSNRGDIPNGHREKIEDLRSEHLSKPLQDHLPPQGSSRKRTFLSVANERSSQRQPPAKKTKYTLQTPSEGSGYRGETEKADRFSSSRFGSKYGTEFPRNVRGPAYFHDRTPKSENLSKQQTEWITRAPSFQEAERIFQDIPEKDIYNYNAMLSMYTKHQRHVDARRLFETMKQGRTKPDAVSYNILIKGYIEGKAQTHLASVQAILQDMKDHQVRPDVFTYSSLIAVCASVGTEESLDLALHFFKEMKEHSIIPNQKTYSSLMQACAQVGTQRSLEFAQSFIQEMADNRQTVEKTTYNAFFNVCAKVGTEQSLQQHASC